VVAATRGCRRAWLPRDGSDFHHGLLAKPFELERLKSFVIDALRQASRVD